MLKFALVSLFCNLLLVAAADTILPFNAGWRYYNMGLPADSDWVLPSYSDATWSGGFAEFGYGDGDENTLLSYGPDSAHRYRTVYFRKTFSLPAVGMYPLYLIHVKRDDGIAIYVNGNELYRNNLPSGPLHYDSLASIASDDGELVHSLILPISYLVDGVNQLAVEIHQESDFSPDLSFDLAIEADPVPQLIRGPYLQLGSTHSLMIRAHTDIPIRACIHYGNDPDSFTNIACTDVDSVDHEIWINGLSPDTRYYYYLEANGHILSAGPQNYFITAPPVGSERPIHIWAAGDCGTGTAEQQRVRDAYLHYMKGKHTDAWLLVGDNAYGSGYENEFQQKFFNIYRDSLLPNVMLYPAPGNHDYANSIDRQNDHAIPYYDLFSLADSGQLGGIPSGTESYYSFDYGNVHFLSLDSYGRDSAAFRLYDTTGPQLRWIKKDLAANEQDWTIVYFHHPPFTMGSHNSDLEAELIQIRQNFVQILERFNVDLIICGHSHNYERSYLMNGHYGPEDSFDIHKHVVDSSSAAYNGSPNSCPYVKSDLDHRSASVYVVAGSAGRVGGTQLSYPHNAMPFSYSVKSGSFAITIEKNRLDACFIAEDSAIYDRFTIMKNVGRNTDITSLSDSLLITASWIGTYVWDSTSIPGPSRMVPVPILGQQDVYIVKDSFSCLIDSFRIRRNLILPGALLSFEAERMGDSAYLFWTSAMEVNTDKYLIERSGDALVFNEIGVVSAHGNSIIPLEYHFTDTLPLTGTNYYRLKMLDNTGHAIYSSVRKLDFPTPIIPLRIVPNPARDWVSIQIPSDKPGKYHIEVIDSRGSRIRSLDFINEASNNSFLLSTQAWEKTWYLIELRNEEGRLLQRAELVVQ